MNDFEKTLRINDINTDEEMNDYFKKAEGYNFDGHFNFPIMTNALIQHLIEPSEDILKRWALDETKSIPTKSKYMKAFEIENDEEKFIVLAIFNVNYRQSKKYMKMLSEEMKKTNEESDFMNEFVASMRLENKIEENLDEILDDLLGINKQTRLNTIKLMKIEKTEKSEDILMNIKSKNSYINECIMEYNPPMRSYKNKELLSHSQNRIYDPFSIIDFLKKFHDIISNDEYELIERKSKTLKKEKYEYIAVDEGHDTAYRFAASLAQMNNGFIKDEFVQKLQEFMSKGLTKTFETELKNFQDLFDAYDQWKNESGENEFGFNDLDNTIMKFEFEDGYGYGLKDQNGDFVISCKKEGNKETIKFNETKSVKSTRKEMKKEVENLLKTDLEFGFASFVARDDTIEQAKIKKIDTRILKELNKMIFDIGSALTCLKEEIEINNKMSP